METPLTPDQLIRGLLKLSETEHVSLLDSCAVGHLGSHLLIAGIGGSRTPSSALGPRTPSSAYSLADLQKLIDDREAVIFTLSYDLGAELNGVLTGQTDEPYITATAFDELIIHDYSTGETRIAGDRRGADDLLNSLKHAAERFQLLESDTPLLAKSNMRREEYIASIETIQERIRCGDTYQTNLTQQITAETGKMRPQDVFWRLRRDHPAPFAAFIARDDSTVLSASPERFFRIAHRVGSPYTSKGYLAQAERKIIETAPIKGTRPRGKTPEDDERLRNDLLRSPKDRAENTMIVDLLRNDLGRVCEYGSVRVDKLCELEEHPTLFHLVSTVTGELREEATFADVIRALFPCGSITGAPKISTMRIIDEIEPSPRGLSMGAIGCSIPVGFDGLDPVIDLSVAIRTMVFRDGVATFNVGGGITIDSDPEAEYDESLLKAKALLSALGAELRP